MHLKRTLAGAVLATMVAGAAAARAAAPTVGWVERHDGGGLFNDDGWCVATDPAGNVVVAGESADGVAGIDLCVRKLARGDGHQLWEARYQGYDGKDVTVADITWDMAGQLLVAGFIRGCVG
jgi:hypothetical protein